MGMSGRAGAGGHEETFKRSEPGAREAQIRGVETNTLTYSNFDTYPDRNIRSSVEQRYLLIPLHRSGEAWCNAGKVNGS